MGEFDINHETLKAARARLVRDRERRAARKWGWIYFAAAGDLVKIGVSRAPGPRVDQLRTGNSQPVELVGVLFIEEHVHLRERDIYDQFAAERVHGEWFKITPRLSAWIRQYTRLPHDNMMRAQRRKRRA